MHVSNIFRSFFVIKRGPKFGLQMLNYVDCCGVVRTGLLRNRRPPRPGSLKPLYPSLKSSQTS